MIDSSSSSTPPPIHGKTVHERCNRSYIDRMLLHGTERASLKRRGLRSILAEITFLGGLSCFDNLRQPLLPCEKSYETGVQYLVHCSQAKSIRLTIVPLGHSSTNTNLRLLDLALSVGTYEERGGVAVQCGRMLDSLGLLHCSRVGIPQVRACLNTLNLSRQNRH